VCVSVCHPLWCLCAAWSQSPTPAFDSTVLRHVTPTVRHGEACGGGELRASNYNYYNYNNYYFLIVHVAGDT